jgi:NADH/NAD ratio-sensing transcriptional regulator Rex
MTERELPEALRDRMIRLYLLLNGMDEAWQNTVMSSRQLASALGTSAEIVRKDLNTLSCSAGGRGYKPGELTRQLRQRLGLERKLKAGFAGLDSWGSVLIREGAALEGIEIAAAFDGSQNRLERTETAFPLYPSYEIREVFLREKILIGILASDSGHPRKNLERMLEGGARGIINLSSTTLQVPSGFPYCHADLRAGLLNIISRISGMKE